MEALPPLPALCRRRYSIADVGELRTRRETYRRLKLPQPAATVNENGVASRKAASSRVRGLSIIASTLIFVFVRRLRKLRAHRLTANTGDNVRVRNNDERRSDRADLSNAEQPPHLPAVPVQPAAQPLPEYIHLLLLATFAHLPHRLVNAVMPLPLARLGFFYVGGGRYVRCYFCGTDVPLLGGHESSTLRQHETLSPGCLLTGPGHPQSMTAARSVLLGALRGVEIRGVYSAHALSINLR